MDLAASLALGDWTTADRLVHDDPGLLDNGGSGTLHLMARRNDGPAVQWLLHHGVDPNARWTEWGSEVTALHMAAGSGAVEVARLLLAAGADTRVRDTRFDSEPLGWAEHFGQVETRRLLEARATSG